MGRLLDQLWRAAKCAMRNATSCEWPCKDNDLSTSVWPALTSTATWVQMTASACPCRSSVSTTAKLSGMMWTSTPRSSLRRQQTHFTEVGGVESEGAARRRGIELAHTAHRGVDDLERLTKPQGMADRRLGEREALGSSCDAPCLVKRMAHDMICSGYLCAVWVCLSFDHFGALTS